MSDGRKPGREVLQKAAKSVAAMSKRNSKASSTLRGQEELQRASKSLAAVSRVTSTRRKPNVGSTLKGRRGSFVRKKTKGSAEGSDDDEDTAKWHVHCMRSTRACMRTRLLTFACSHVHARASCAHMHAHTHSRTCACTCRCTYARPCMRTPVRLLHARSYVTTCAHIKHAHAHAQASTRAGTRAQDMCDSRVCSCVQDMCDAHAHAHAYA